jgi:hypothetical protein
VDGATDAIADGACDAGDGLDDVEQALKARAAPAASAKMGLTFI